MFVNGSRNLLTVVKNKQMLRMLLREGMEITIQVHGLALNNVHVTMVIVGVVNVQVHEMEAKKEVTFCKQGEETFAFSKDSKMEGVYEIFREFV